MRHAIAICILLAIRTSAQAELVRTDFTGIVTRVFTDPGLILPGSGVNPDTGGQPTPIDIGDPVTGYFQWYDDPADYDEVRGGHWTKYGDHRTVALSLQGPDYSRTEHFGAMFHRSVSEGVTGVSAGQHGHAGLSWSGLPTEGAGGIGEGHNDIKVYFDWQAVPEPSTFLLLVIALPVLVHGIKKAA